MTAIRSNGTLTEPASQNQYSRISIYASLLVALISLSFKSYFYFIPFQNGVNLLSILGFFSLAGWVLLAIVPPLLLNSNLSKWSIGKSTMLIIASSIWTLSTLAIKIYGLATVGQLWASYLLLYPILIFVEWILPIYYIVVAVRLAKAKRF